MEVTTPTKEMQTMTKTQILAQLSDLVDAYIDLNDTEGDAPATTFDFILATSIVLGVEGQGNEQATIDDVSPISVVQYEAGESTDQDEVVITIGDEVEITNGDHTDQYGTVVGFQVGAGFTNVTVEIIDEDANSIITTMVALDDVVA